jgi:hypothetical protein
MTEPPGMGLVLDCHDPEALAPFWAAALGYVTLGSVENCVLLVPDSRPDPKLLSRGHRRKGRKELNAPRHRGARH